MTQIARALCLTMNVTRMLCLEQKLSSTCSPFPGNSNVLHFHVNRLPLYHTSFVVARNGHSVSLLFVWQSQKILLMFRLILDRMTFCRIWDLRNCRFKDFNLIQSSFMLPNDRFKVRRRKNNFSENFESYWLSFQIILQCRF